MADLYKKYVKNSDSKPNLKNKYVKNESNIQEELRNRILDWNKKSNTYITQARARYFGATGTMDSSDPKGLLRNYKVDMNSWEADKAPKTSPSYTGPQFSNSGKYEGGFKQDASDWYTKMHAEKSFLDTEAQAINDFIRDNDKYISGDVKTAWNKLYSASQNGQNSALSTAKLESNLFGDYETEEDFIKGYEDSRYQSRVANTPVTAAKAELESRKAILEGIQRLRKNPNASGRDVSEYERMYSGDEATFKRNLEEAQKFYDDVVAYDEYKKYQEEYDELIGDIEHKEDYYGTIEKGEEIGLTEDWSFYGTNNKTGATEPFAETVGDPIIYWRKKPKEANQELALREHMTPEAENNRIIAENMTEAEYNAYVYHIGKGDKKKAEQLLNFIKDEIVKRESDANYEFFGGEDNSSLEQIALQFAYGGQNFFDGLLPLYTDEESYASQARKQTTAQIGEDLERKGYGTANDLAFTIGNQVPAIIASALTTLATGNPVVGSFVGNASMGLSATGNAYEQAKNMGYSDEEAWSYGALVGASEMAIGTLLSGVGTMTGSLTGKGIGSVVDKIDDVVLKAGTSKIGVIAAKTAKIAVEHGGRMASEFGEEYLQAVLEPWYQNITLGTNNSINPFSSEALEAGLLGALSAGVINASQSVATLGVNTGAKAINNYRTGKQLKADGIDVNQIADIGKKFSADTVAYKIANKVDENTGAYTIGKLFNEVNATMSEQNKAEIIDTLVNKGVLRADAEILVDSIETSMALGEDNFSVNERYILDNNPALNEAVRKVLVDKNTTLYQRISGTVELNKQLTEKALQKVANKFAKGESVSDEEIDSFAEETDLSVDAMNAENITASVDEVSSKSAPNSVKAESKTYNTIDNAEEAVSPVTKIVSTKEGKVKYQTKDGETVDASEAVFRNEDEAVIYETALDMGLPAAVINYAVNEYDSNTASALEYIYGVRTAYEYGASGIHQSYISSDALSALSHKQRQDAYELGKAIAQDEVATRQKAIKDKVSKSKNAENKKGKVQMDGKEYNVDTVEGLTEVQKESVRASKFLAEVLGNDINLYNSYVATEGKYKGRRVYKKANGEVALAPNGFYNPDGSINIDINAGSNGEGIILETLGHELTHHIRAWSPAKFKVMADFLFDQYYKHGVDVQGLIHEQIAKAKRNGRTISYDIAYEEVVADAFSRMLTDTDAISKLAKTDKGLYNKVKAWIKGIVNKINKLYSRYDPQSKEAQYAKKMNDVASELQRLWLEGLEDASKAYSTVAETDRIENDNVQQSENSQQKFSLRGDVEETKDLIAVHNLSEEKLLKTLELGGFPMPSIAVFKSKEGHTDFGDISVVFGKETIDPQLLHSNKVFSGDAYTPTYPHIDYKINKTVVEKGVDDVERLIKSKGFGKDDFGYLSSISEDNFKYGNTDEVANKTALKVAYLIDKGIDFKPVYKEGELSDFGRFDNYVVKHIAEALGKERIVGLHNNSEGVKAAVEEIRNLANKYKANKYKDNAELFDTLSRNPFYGENNFGFSQAHEIVEGAYKYFNNGSQPKINEWETKKAIAGLINQADYKKWVDDLFEGFIEKEGIRNNKDIFTSSGNRRSFEALHYEHNLENVVKAMKEEGIKGIGGFGGGNIFGASTIEYNSISNIKNSAQNRLQNLSDEEFAEIKKGFADRFYELASSLPNNKESFSATDDAANVLVEAISKYKTKSGIANYIRRECQGWATYSEHIVDDLIELVSDIRQMPTKYFEAKPQRAVGFDEVKAIIIPDNSSSKLKSALKSKSFDVLEYQSGNKQERIDALNSLDEIKFSGRGKGYDGYSMSNNARAAYADGEKPLSKWNKQNILEEIYAYADEDVQSKLDKSGVKELTTEELKSYFLKNSSWHHTGRFYNRTDFYIIDENAVSSISAEVVDEIKKQRIRKFKSEEEKQNAIKNQKALAEAKQLYEKMNLILRAGVVKYKTLNGLAKAWLNGTVGEAEYRQAMDVYDQKMRRKIEQWKYLPKDHPNHEIIKEYETNKEEILKKEFGLSVPNNNKVIQFIKSSILEKEAKAENQILHSDRDIAPTFYSYMGKVVDEIKPAKMGAGGVVSYLKGKGVKNEEIKWSGIETFLEGKKSVTKQELQEFVAGSQLQIEEEEKYQSAALENFLVEWRKIIDYDYEQEGDLAVDDDFILNTTEFLQNAVDEGNLEQSEMDKLLSLAEKAKDEHPNAMPTKWEDYKLDGGKNYRELLFKMPNENYTNREMKAHWGNVAKGIIAHARIQDFDVNGKRMLFVEEIQSDWHNKGHKEGYVDKTKGATTKTTTVKHEDSAVPDAPFRDNYHEYVMKRLLRIAAEEGYDSIGWTTAETQSKRWSDEYAEGYRIEYDQDIPKFLRKYGKKWGATVGSERINGNEVWSMDITDSMRNSVLHEGQTMYSDRDTDGGFSQRSLLANALESTAESDQDKKTLAQYKKNIAMLSEAQDRLQKVNAKIKELSFGKGKRDTKQLANLKRTAKELTDLINRYDKKLFSLESTDSLKRVLEVERKKAYAKATEEGRNNLQAYKDKMIQREQNIRDKYQESRAKAVEKRSKTEMKNKIKKLVGKLDSLLRNQTKEKHIPIYYQKSVAQMLEILNLDEQLRVARAEKRMTAAEEKYTRLLDEEKAKENPDAELIEYYQQKLDENTNTVGKVSEAIQSLKDAYHEITTSNDSIYVNNPEVENLLDGYRQYIGDTQLSKMTLQQLDYVYNSFKIVDHMISEANKGHKLNRSKTISDYAEEAVGEVRESHKTKTRTLSSVKIGKSEIKVPHMVSNFKWDYKKPWFAFRSLGSKVMNELYDNLRKGEDTWAVDIQNATKKFEELAEKYEINKWNFDKKFKCGNVEITLDQLLSLYAYSKREAADEHLAEGGFVFDSSVKLRKGKNGIFEYQITMPEPQTVSKTDMIELMSNLTDDMKELKAWADEMQDYLSSDLSAIGNEVSRELYGINLFNEKHYFPIKVMQEVLDFNAEKHTDIVPNITNMGMTKPVLPNANNTIVLGGFTDIWARHCNDMAKYHAFALAMDDFTKVYNYGKGAQSFGKSVKVAIKNAKGLGDAANKYIQTFLQDVNGGVRADEMQGIDALISKFKKSSVMASASVVIQQPSAIGRAFGMINPKYFVKTDMNINHAKTVAEMEKYAPIAIIKRLGGFDTNTSGKTSDIILGKDNEGVIKKANNALGYAPQKADELTWCAIWNACKREAKNKYNLEGEELLKKAGERFTEVIQVTQVYDSVFSRNAMMRSKSKFNKMVTAFMAEPITAMNDAVYAVQQIRQGNKKAGTSMLLGGLTSLVINSVLSSIVYAWRDDDEDETYAEKFISSAVGETVEGLNPITYLPVIKDVYSLMQGYDVERTDMALVSDVIDKVGNIITAYSNREDDMTDEELAEAQKEIEQAWIDAGFEVLNIFGIPADNLRREIVGIAQTVTRDNDYETTWSTVMEAISEKIRDAKPFGRLTDDESKSDKIYQAIAEGDTEKLKRLKDSYTSEKAYESAMRQGLRDNDERIKAAAKAGYEGNERERVRICKEIIAEGLYSQDMVVKAVNAEINKLAKDEPEEEKEDTPEYESDVIYKASDINDAIEYGDIEGAYEIIGELVEDKKNKYLFEAEQKGERLTEREAEKKAKSSLKSTLTSHWKDIYIEAYKNGDDEECKRIRQILGNSELWDRKSEVSELCRNWLKEARKK